jgi:uncharacterized membrane protein YtjA (UPF0391 family)
VSPYHGGRQRQRRAILNFGGNDTVRLAGYLRTHTNSQDARTPRPRHSFAVCDRAYSPGGRQRDSIMLKWALIFFLISLVAGVFGFTNIAAGTRTIAKWLFFIAISIFVLFLVLALVAGNAML